MISTMTRLLFLAVLKYASHLLLTVGITMTDPFFLWCVSSTLVTDCHHSYDWSFAFLWCVSSTLGWVLIYIHRNHRLIRDGSPGRPPWLSHSSWALRVALLLQTVIIVMTGPLLSCGVWVAYMLQTVRIAMTGPLLSCDVWVAYMLHTVRIAMTGPLLSCDVWVAYMLQTVRIAMTGPLLELHSCYRLSNATDCHIAKAGPLHSCGVWVALLQTVIIAMTNHLLSGGVWVAHLVQTMIRAMTGPLLFCGVQVAHLLQTVWLEPWLVL